MESQRVRLTTNAFFGDNEIELVFPSNWEVTECRMSGHDKAPLSEAEMRKALQNPIGSPRLSVLAKGKKQVAILFDDIPKPTRANRIVPFVLEELHAGGIKDEQIRFICAPGTHRPLTQPELGAKLGWDILEKYMVFNHTIWENVVNVGTTKRGTPVSVNREYWSCDLHVGIGSIFPHGSAGYGGGAKMILPGISSVETIVHHHKNMREGAKLGNLTNNEFREDLEDAARLAKLDFKVDCVLTRTREVAALFAGDFVAEHRAGAAVAAQLYCTDMPKESDVVIANAYPDEMQMGRATWVFPQVLKQGGDAVVISHSWEGENLHQIGSRFGTDYGGRSYQRGNRGRNMTKADRVFVMAPHLSKYEREELGASDKVVWGKTWADILAGLASRHGAGTKVAVFPYAPLQIPG